MHERVQRLFKQFACNVLDCDGIVDLQFFFLIIVFGLRHDHFEFQPQLSIITSVYENNS
jgi:hypothetical protein